MYDLITSTLLFVVLVPGVVLSIGSGVLAALIHGVVFYVVQAFLSQYVSRWIIWAIVIAAVGWRLSSSGGVSSSY
jgi:hypothetical protein